MAVTIVSGVIISLLFISELAFFLSTDVSYTTPSITKPNLHSIPLSHSIPFPQVREELFVDTSRGEKLKINIDIDFPKMPCSCESC